MSQPPSREEERGRQTTLQLDQATTSVLVSLVGLAGLVAVQHVLAHPALRPIPISVGWQDVLVGYPTAIVLAIIGAIALDLHPRI